MRILLSSMPFVALVAILATSTVKKLDYAAQKDMARNNNALPETVAIFKQVQEKAKADRERRSLVSSAATPLPLEDVSETDALASSAS